jgi:DegV family protein with EDD domain
MSLAIVTDSVADLPEPVARELGITVVPLIVSFGGESFRDGVDLDNDAFYERLKSGGTTPVTSAPSPASYAEAMDAAAEAHDEVLVITLSAKLSATHSSALQGRQLMKRRCRVVILDCHWAAMAQGFIVMAAARAAARGAGLVQAMTAARGVEERVGFLAAFDTLEYLRRGGRIGAAAALLGSLLNVNPLIDLADGVVRPVGRARSRSRAIEQLVAFAATYQHIEELAVESTACDEDAALMVDRLGPFFPREKILRTRMTPVIGVHTGPGLLVVAVHGERRGPA